MPRRSAASGCRLPCSRRARVGSRELRQRCDSGAVLISPARAQQQQADERLGVAGLLDRGVEVVQRPRDDLDALVLAGVGAARVAQALGEVDVDGLVGEADRRVVGRQVLPAVGLLADLLGQLARGAWPAGSRPPCRAARRAAPGRRGRRSASRGWRTSQTCVSSTATTAAAPGWRTISRSTSSPSAKRKRSTAHVDDPALEDRSGRRAARSRARSCHSGYASSSSSANVDVEHPLQRRLAHALGRLVVALGAVGQVGAREARRPRRRWRPSRRR